MKSWVATAYGALDLREAQWNRINAEVMLLSTLPSEPFGLSGIHAELWRRLVDGPVLDRDLDEEQRALVREYAEAGIASDDPAHPARIRRLEAPWLSSPFHELVYAVVGSVARDNGIDFVVIKGPILHRQGLRDREHSGDVDVWVEPQRVDELSERMVEWGWTRQREFWDGTAVNHSVTLEPGEWGCEVDVHRQFPGSALPDGTAFGVALSRSEAVLFAGVECAGLQRPANAVVHALHLTRPEFGGKANMARVSLAAEALLIEPEGSREFVRELDATAALAPVLRAAFPEEELGPVGEAPLNWRWRGKRDRGLAYLAALEMVPLRQRPRIVWRMLWPPEDVLRLSDRLAGLNETPLFIARLRRLKRGIREVVRRH